MTSTAVPQTSLDVALCLAAKGWHIFPVRVMRSPGGKKIAKPIDNWNDASTTDTATIERWYNGAWATAGIGIDCGKSGIVVIDADAKDDTDGIANLEALGLPRAVLVVKTPGGGEHRYYAAADVPVRNSQGTLAPAVDVRGDGGFIFAPGSTDFRGVYEVAEYVGQADGVGFWSDLDTGDKLTPVPQYVIDNNTKRKPEKTKTKDPGQAYTSGKSQASHGTTNRTFTKKQAADFVSEGLARLRNAQNGEINNALFEAALMLAHFGPEFWPRQTAEALLSDALASTVADDDTWKARDTLNSAFSYTPDWMAELVEEPAPPIAEAFGDPGEDPDPTFLDKVRADPEFAKKRYERLVFHLADADARERLKKEKATDGDDYTRLVANLYDLDGLSAIEPPKPLIDGVLLAGALTTLSGKPGSLKSFTSLGWACSLASGTPWLGHAVPEAGPVVYVAAEGSSGVRLRVDAWKKAHRVGIPTENLIIITVPVQIGSAASREAIARIAAEKNAKLVVFDTLSRCAVGLEENSNTDMRAVAATHDLIREKSGAATLFIHHAGHLEDRARGASTLIGDPEVAWFAKGDRVSMRLENNKLKDAEPHRPVTVRLSIVEGTGSGVLVQIKASGEDFPDSDLLGFLSDAGPQGVTFREIGLFLYPDETDDTARDSRARGFMNRRGHMVKKVGQGKVQRLALRDDYPTKSENVHQEDGLGYSPDV